MVALLEKLDAAEGFEQIIDFLNGSYIHYDLTVNPHIYVSCIKQFWNTASVKRSDDVTRLQALVDRKNIMISEDVICEILQLADAEGVVCLPNEEIFVGLAQMGYEKPSTKFTFYKAFFSSQWKFLIHTLLQSLSAKRTSWNEFSSAMASAVICLSKGWERFLRVETPLFECMLTARTITEEGIAEKQVQADNVVAAAVQESSSPQAPPQSAKFPTHLFQQVLDTCSALNRHVENLEHDKAAQKLEIIKLKERVKRLERANKVKSSKLRHLKKVGTSQRIKSSDDMEVVFNQGKMIDDLDKDEGIELVVNQVKDADIAEIEGRHAAEQAEKQAEIYHLDLDHPSKVLSMQEDDSDVQEVVEVITTAKLITEVVTAAISQVSVASATISAAKPSIPAAALTVTAAYTRRRKVVIIRDPEEELSSKTPAETPKLKDKGKGILIETPKPMKKKDQIELDAEYARKLHEEINKDIDWDAAIDHVKQKSKENPQYIKRYQVMKKRPQTEIEARKNMMIYLKNTVGYKLDFFKGMSYDEICPIFQARFNENMRFLFKLREEMEEEDQEIVLINNKPRFKIIKADETHQLYISFITLLKNFDREDLENLWRIVKERFSTSKPSNFSDEYLLTTLKTIFEKPDGQDTLILLVERRYPLSKFTLEQLVNVTRLQVEAESEMSLELLRFTRQQLQEHQQG
uniref:Synaptobrevin, longin-like domain protein n=1 Tax=Tanacetum cinerariifolium TaxID=118510 RepID=A0A699JST5_TANCI|nr:hypothetical protein [Tanacetum cinerariifolium]